MGVQTNINSANRLIVFHMGGNNGFHPNEELIYRAGSATGDYHGQMNPENFKKLVVEIPIPNLPPKSVIILDNVPYHCPKTDKPPSAYAKKAFMAPQERCELQ
jgi:hypothetical protein